MVRMPDYAVMVVYVSVPPTMSAEEAAREVEKSISFGQPEVTLLGYLTHDIPSDDNVDMRWVPQGGWAPIPQPPCYQSGLGPMVHGPGCTCPDAEPGPAGEDRAE